MEVGKVPTWNKQRIHGRCIQEGRGGFINTAWGLERSQRETGDSRETHSLR